MTNYFRVILGKGHAYAAECFADGFIGTDFGIEGDLTGKFPEEWREFNKAYIPIYLEGHPQKSRIAAGLACGAIWTVSKFIAVGDVVLCPDGSGKYRVGDVSGPYYYSPGGVLPHRRPVKWRDVYVDPLVVTDDLRHSMRSIGTVADVSAYGDELSRLIGDPPQPVIVSTDPDVLDPSAFAMEKHLEDFLVENWSQTELGKEFDIYEEDGRKGQQYPTDTGPMDILAISKDKKRLLVVELKRGRATDVVVGQVLRYIGFAQEELAEEEQTVHGVVIALEDDIRMRRALASVPHVKFYRYQVAFKLVKA